MLFAAIEWRSHEVYTYLAIAGGAIILLSLALYVLPFGGLKLAARLLGLVGGLGLGLGLGVMLMGAWGYQLETPAYAYPNGFPAGMGGNPPGRGDLGIVTVQFPGAAPMLPPGGSTFKPQLVVLVNKLDMLTERPLTIELSEAQRREIKEQLRGLSNAEDLTDEDAKARVAALHEVLKDQRNTLEAAGYRWSGQAGGVPPGLAPTEANPFKMNQNAAHLKALTGRLEKGDKG